MSKTVSIHQKKILKNYPGETKVFFICGIGATAVLIILKYDDLALDEKIKRRQNLINQLVHQLLYIIPFY